MLKQQAKQSPFVMNLSLNVHCKIIKKRLKFKKIPEKKPGKFRSGQKCGVIFDVNPNYPSVYKSEPIFKEYFLHPEKK